MEWLVEIASSNLILGSIIGGLIISFLNAVGVFPALFKVESKRVLDMLMGFAAGVMICSSFTSLIMPGIEMENGTVYTLGGVAIGGFFIFFIDKSLPHLHLFEKIDLRESKLKTSWLLLFAITIHNIPEGMAVGVGFGAGDYRNAITLMLAIGLQNIPEGFSTCAGLISSQKYSKKKATAISILAGLVELPMCILGAILVTVSQALLPLIMGFAGGAMLYVVSDEIIPESHANGHEDAATLGTLSGLIVMLILDVTL
ncbi:MAG: ZIP family metal transporter [Candidatus Korarchaeota archaeon]